MLIRRLQSSDASSYQYIRRHALNDMPQFVGPLAEQEALCELPELQARIDNYEAEGVPARALHQRFGFVSCGVEPQALWLNGRFYDFELMQMTLTNDP